MPWKTFLKAHWGPIAAADFFSVEVLTRGGLVRYLVLFVIELMTRLVHISGITSCLVSPDVIDAAKANGFGPESDTDRWNASNVDSPRKTLAMVNIGGYKGLEGWAVPIRLVG